MRAETMYLDSAVSGEGRPVQWSRNYFLPGKLSLRLIRDMPANRDPGHRAPVGHGDVSRSAREILRALGGKFAVQQAGGLADLDEVSVRVSYVAADLRPRGRSAA